MKRFALVGLGIHVLIMGISVAMPAHAQNLPQNVTPTAKTSAGDVNTFMKNVRYHLTDRIAVDITTLAGTLTPKPDQMVVLDDKQSFIIDIDSASARLTATSLTNDLNDFVFAAHDAPLKKLSASIHGDQFSVKGLLASKGDIPFEITGTLIVTPEGVIRVHTTSVKALHLPVKGLMDMLGLDTAKLLNTKKVEGVSVDKDDLILEPEVILPPPRFRGHLSSIKVENGEIALTFTPQAGRENHSALKNSCGVRNYIQFEGGTVRILRLTMADADVTLADANPADPFDFSMNHYKEQLVAGYTKMMPQGGLCVYMSAYDKIKSHARPPK